MHSGQLISKSNTSVTEGCAEDPPPPSLAHVLLTATSLCTLTTSAQVGWRKKKKKAKEEFSDWRGGRKLVEDKVLMLEQLNVGIQPLFPMRVAGFFCIPLNIVALF